MIAVHCMHTRTKAMYQMTLVFYAPLSVVLDLF